MPEPLGPGEVEPLGEGAADAALEVAEDVHPPDVEEVVVLGRLAPGRKIWFAIRNDIFKATLESGSRVVTPTALSCVNSCLSAGWTGCKQRHSQK